MKLNPLLNRIMKNIKSLSSGSISANLLAVLAGLLLSIGSLNAESFGRMVSFGDSLADTGNVFYATGGALPPADIYANGRFSNGAVWTEYLAEDMELDLVSYALGGSLTNDQNLFYLRWGIPIPGLSSQVDLYLYHVGYNVPESDLITVVIGANDFIGYFEQHPVGSPVQAAHNTLANMQKLIQGGAEHIVVLGIPDLSITPEFIADMTEDQLKQLKEAVKAHNTILKKGLYELRKAHKIDIVYVNVFEEINNIVEDPLSYGISNTSIPGYFVVGAPVNIPPVDTFLFWDGVHPTTTGHRLLADAVYDAMVDHYGDD